MPVQLFRLRNVPDDEANEIRDLLTNNHIDHYETPAGNWGISMPAIWLNDESQLNEAKSLIAQYQNERQARIRNEYEQGKREGKHRSIISELIENPIQFILYIAIAAVILYFSIQPFLNFGQ
ncbi:MAG: DUF6164 family protein [Gammaproteobacteria bacterium]